MRVLYITTSNETNEGSGKALLQMLNELRKQGVVPMVITPLKKSLYKHLQNQGISCTTLCAKFRMSVYPLWKTRLDKILFIPRLIGRMWVNSLATIELLRIAKQFKPDIIHTNVSVTPIGYYVAKLLKLPHVWHIREYGAIDIHTFYYYPTFTTQKRRYKRANSYTIGITKDILRYNNLLHHCHATTIYDGVLPANMTQYNPHKQPYLLYAGRLEKIKGILPLIDAYAEYCKRHSSPLPLHIAGSGIATYTQLVKNKISNYGLEDKIFLLGMQNDILSLYREAKALIVPSLSEGFGFITAEAMFSGCLVIGNDVAGTKEQFDNGKEQTGEEIALRYTLQEELVQHLINVTNSNIEHYEPMILRAQQVVKQLYSTEQNAQGVYLLYTSIVNKNK
jgi:glycosyltransferase involved in cell wall biosynthesis